MNNHTIQIKHRLTDAVLFEFTPTAEQQASGMAMRAAMDAAVRSGANLRGANLRGANLRGANLRGANLRDAYLGDANLGDAYLGDANLRDAYLGGAYLGEAYLGDANLRDAYLGGAYLGDAYLRDANLRDAYLGGAYLGGANLGDMKLVGNRPFLQVGPIGSRSDFLLSFVTDKGVYLRAGCFFGTVAEFTEKLDKEHSDNDHGQEYRAALALIECHAKLWPAESEVAA